MSEFKLLIQYLGKYMLSSSSIGTDFGEIPVPGHLSASPFTPSWALIRSDTQDQH